MESIGEKKRRGRKPKNVVPPTSGEIISEKIPKKRGRKPKGGKVVICQPTQETDCEQKVNIILHLKCNYADIQCIPGNTAIMDSVENFKFSETKFNELDYMTYNNVLSPKSQINIPKPAVQNDINDTITDSMKIIWHKLEKLSNNLHIDNICDKKSACFFCTCDFDNVPIYIPKYEINHTFYVYGCFCSPECACAFLMNEKNIDTTTRFERYQLLNFLYCKIYDYSKNIKPAPSPYYLLDKYYGNLSIQEYRKLLKNERLLLVVDKPLIRALPELHDDTDEYLLNYQGIAPNSTKYTLQKQTKQHSKNTILNEQFNLKN
jgi:hypothetical protein